MAPFAPVPLALASIVASPRAGTAPFTTTFKADVLGTLKPFAYSWNFGDSASDNTASPSHTFGTPGNYSVSVTVRDMSGATETGTISVLVSAPVVPPWTIPVVIVLAVSLSIIGLIYYRRRKRSKDEPGGPQTVKKVRRK